MYKRIAVSILLVLIAASAFAGGQTETPEAEKVEKTYNLRFAAVGNAEQTATKALYVFKDEIQKSTNGQISVEVHHSGSLFKRDQIIPAIMRGNLEMGMASAPTMAEFVPYLSMFSAGYLFNDYEHMAKVLQGEMGQELFDRVAADSGVRPLAAMYLGAREINLRDIGIEVRTPADLKGVKLRMPGSPAWLFLGEALGANPTPLAFGELYMALKTGTVDGQDNPLPNTKQAKFYEVTSTISLTNHYISTIWPCISEKIWQDMGPELQKKIMDAIEAATKFNDEANLKDEAELVDFFRAEGLTVIKPDIKAFSTHVRNAYLNNKDMIKDWDMDLYNEIVGMGE
jgi:tripartite ATP-independent transporter DctP family solute receptor